MNTVKKVGKGMGYILAVSAGGMIAAFLIIWAGVHMAVWAMDQNSRVDCAQWETEAKQIAPWNGKSGYYILPWQKEECASVGMIVDAPVIKNN